MKKLLFFIALCLAAPAAAQSVPHWEPADAQRLAQWLDSAADDGLEQVAAQANPLRAAIARGDADRIDALSTSAGTRLLNALRGHCCGPAPSPEWHIERAPALADPVAVLRAGLGWDTLDALFANARPSHPYYLALRRAYATETDPVRRHTLALNMARWRWMPRDLGERYLLVNAAAFELTLWEDGELAGRWRTINGRPRTPTPVFRATVSGAIVNPWWEIPSSIAAEGIAAMVRYRPAEARRRGYVYQDGRYRQRPGPGNALGRMKLVMPNPYSVFLHDTSNRSLFEQENRALSHGCIRVGDAMDFLATLLSVQPGWNRERVDGLVEAGATVTVELDEPIPVYVAYFTAAPGEDGTVRYYDDLYGRDAGVALSAVEGGDPMSECSDA